MVIKFDKPAGRIFDVGAVGSGKLWRPLSNRCRNRRLVRPCLTLELSTRMELARTGSPRKSVKTHGRTPNLRAAISFHSYSLLTLKNLSVS